MSIIRSQYATIHGERTEVSRRTFKFEDRHFTRESRSQNAQLDNGLMHGRRKDIK